MNQVSFDDLPHLHGCSLSPHPLVYGVTLPNMPGFLQELSDHPHPGGAPGCWCGGLYYPQLRRSCSSSIQPVWCTELYLWAAASGQHLTPQEPTMLQVGLASSDN